jgi:SAM-dependent methyltransferase
MFIKEIDYSKNAGKYDGDCPEMERAVPPKSKVLDIGCSTGKLAKALKKKGCEVYGIDIDKESLKKAAKFCTKVYQIDLDNLKSFDEKLRGQKFDAITMGDILEHLKYPGVLLEHLKKYLNPGGVLISTIPNIAFVFTRMKFLLGDFSYSKRGLMDEDHLRFFTFTTARMLFKETGYELDVFRPSSHGIVSKKYFFIKPLARIWPGLFAIHIFVVAKKPIKQNG